MIVDKSIQFVCSLPALFYHTILYKFQMLKVLKLLQNFTVFFFFYTSLSEIKISQHFFQVMCKVLIMIDPKTICKLF